LAQKESGLAAHRCAHDGDWTLAIRAHAASIQLVKSYTQAVGALQLDDSVLSTFAEAANSLHETAGTPDARAFSKFLVNGMREVGLAVAARQLKAGQSQFLGGGADSGPLFTVEFRVQEMFKRRFADQQSEDPALAIRVLGDLASAAIQVGDDWNAVGMQKFLLEWAPLATDHRFAHLARPLWEESIRTLAELALRATDDHAFMAAGDALDDAIDRIEGFPEFLHFSGFEPVVGALPGSAKSNLSEATYLIWRSENVSISDLVKWTWRTAYSMVSLLRRTEEGAEKSGRRISGNDAQHASELIHQMTLAASERAVADAESRMEVSELAGRLLGALRHIATEQAKSRRARDEVWHCYVTDFVVGLFVTRDDDLPDWLGSEIEALRGAVAGENDAVLPEMLEPGLKWMAEAVVRRSGAKEQAEELVALVTEAGRRVERHRSWGWGLGGGDFYLHRGYVVAAVVDEAQAWLFSESVALGEAPAPGSAEADRSAFSNSASNCPFFTRVPRCTQNFLTVEVIFGATVACSSGNTTASTVTICAISPR